MKELQVPGIGLDDAEAALGGPVLLEQRLEGWGDVRLPQLHLALIGELAPALDDTDGIMIDTEALRARIARGFGERRFDEIEAVELVLGSEPAIGDGE